MQIIQIGRLQITKKRKGTQDKSTPYLSIWLHSALLLHITGSRIEQEFRVSRAWEELLKREGKLSGPNYCHSPTQLNSIQL